jgi:hypothetical protein
MNELELEGYEPQVRRCEAGEASESFRAELLAILDDLLARTKDPKLRGRIADAIKRASGGPEEEDFEPTTAKPEGKI